MPTCTPSDGDVPQEAAEHGAVGNEDREVVESEQAAARRRRRAAPLVQLDERRVAAVRTEPGRRRRRGRSCESDHALVVGDRAGQVGDLQLHRPQARRVGEPVSCGRDAVVETHVNAGFHPVASGSGHSSASTPPP